MGSLIYEDLTYKTRGALFVVYREKGVGFVEGVYQKFIPDFIIDDKIIVEIKAVKNLTDEHRSQIQNYLKATGYKLELLVNFGHSPQIQIERIAN